MAATSAEGGVVGHGGGPFSWTCRLRIGLVPSIGYGGPTCSSHDSNQDQPRPLVQPRAARPGGGGSGGNDGGAGQSRGAGSWPPLPILAGGWGETQRIIPKPPNLVIALFRVHSILTQCEGDATKGSGQPLPRFDVQRTTASLPIVSVARHRMAVSAVPAHGSSSVKCTPQADPTVDQD